MQSHIQIDAARVSATSQFPKPSLRARSRWMFPPWTPPFPRAASAATWLLGAARFAAEPMVCSTFAERIPRAQSSNNVSTSSSPSKGLELTGRIEGKCEEGPATSLERLARSNRRSTECFPPFQSQCRLTRGMLKSQKLLSQKLLSQNGYRHVRLLVLCDHTVCLSFCLSI